MNRLILAFSLTFTLSAGLLGLACAADPAKVADITARYNAAVSDGIITPAEAEELHKLFEGLDQTFDWTAIASTGVGSLVALLLGLKKGKNGSAKTIAELSAQLDLLQRAIAMPPPGK